jgi:hypothetical protein
MQASPEIAERVGRSDLSAEKKSLLNQNKMSPATRFASGKGKDDCRDYHC